MSAPRVRTWACRLAVPADGREPFATMSVSERGIWVLADDVAAETAKLRARLVEARSLVNEALQHAEVHPEHPLGKAFQAWVSALAETEGAT